eukprot:Clim_evm38s253 gene=Clim_evmTU38s253
MVKVGFAGAVGAFSENAAKRFFDEYSFGNEIPTQFVGVESVISLFEKVASGELSYAVLPIENSMSGNFRNVYDLFLAKGNRIVGELALHDELCVCGLPGLELHERTEAYSHPVVFDQCEVNLNKKFPQLRLLSLADTALACQYVKENANVAQVAVASANAARQYGLDILWQACEDDPRSFTKYVVIAKDQKPVKSPSKAKTTIALWLKNSPGALFRAFASFSMRELNISKVESRPSTRAGSVSSATHIWEYTYYMDIECNVEDPRMQNALRSIEEFSEKYQILGCYEALRPTITPASTTGMFSM